MEQNLTANLYRQLTRVHIARGRSHKAVRFTHSESNRDLDRLSTLKMAVLYVKATYADEENLKHFLKSLFGWGKTGIEVCRAVCS